VFGAVSLPGRFEVLGDAPMMIVDCADNDVAAAALHALVDNAIQQAERRVLLCGLTIGHDARQFLASLGAGRFDHIVVTEPDTPRAQRGAEVAAAAAAFDVNVVNQPTISTALQTALSFAGASGLVVAVGSHHLVGPVRELFSAPGYANTALRRATRS
jgi:dihydrofolate synthase/folylpolyglutamate synthase